MAVSLFGWEGGRSVFPGFDFGEDGVAREELESQ